MKLFLIFVKSRFGYNYKIKSEIINEIKKMKNREKNARYINNIKLQKIQERINYINQ